MEVHEAGEFVGAAHPYIGEEGVAVGVCLALKDTDYIAGNHRSHGHPLAKGGSIKKAMAEIYGRVDGYCNGKGGSMHIADRGLGHLGANAIVGGGISHVVGAGLTYQMKHHGNAAVAFFGDGAMQQGVLYESMNLSALWKLPVLFVCVNNEYGMGTRLDHASASLEFEKRAETFGLLAAEVDGIDVFEVYNQSKNLLEDVRKGKPAFLKVNSYRFHGHARMDKSPYRDQQEEEEGRKKDAIAFLRDRIVISGGYQETECDAIVEEVKQEMDEALNHARNAKAPGADEMYEDVFDPQTTKPFPVDSRIRESLHLPQA